MKENKEENGMSDWADSGIYVSKGGLVYDFYLTDEILAPSEYVQWFHVIRNATELDVVKIHINSNGGYLFTAIQFIRVLDETPAHVIVSVEGECSSAATLIFLSGDSFEISPFSSFMFHDYSSGSIGKGGEQFERVQHQREWSMDIMRQIYKDFLTAKEIESIANGKDIWMNGDQVIERLQKKVKKQARRK